MPLNHRNKMKGLIITPRVLTPIIQVVQYEGVDTFVNGEASKMMVSPLFNLRNPQDKIFTDKSRKFNFPLAIANWSANLINVNSEWLTNLLPHKNEIEDEKALFSNKFVNNLFVPRFSELLEISKELILDNSKFVTIKNIKSFYGNINITFYIFNNNLYTNIDCPQTDIIRDFPYLVFLGASFAELFSKLVNYPASDVYFNFPAVYFLKKDKDIPSKFSRQRWPFLAPEMQNITSEQLKSYEGLLNNLHSPIFNKLFDKVKEKENFTFLKDYALILRAYSNRNTNFTIANMAYNKISDKTLKHLLRQWVKPWIRNKTYNYSDINEDYESYED